MVWLSRDCVCVEAWTSWLSHALVQEFGYCGFVAMNTTSYYHVVCSNITSNSTLPRSLQSRMLTVKLPNKMETYIQVKERKRVRDLYAYICEKKGLTASAYKLSYSCKIEKEEDVDKTVAELDIWCVTLENVVGKCGMHTCAHVRTYTRTLIPHMQLTHVCRYTYAHTQSYKCKYIHLYTLIKHTMYVRTYIIKHATFAVLTYSQS